MTAKKEPFLEVDPGTGNMDKKGNLYQLLNNFISAYNHRTTVMVGTSSPKLDAIIDMLRGMASAPADLALVKEELSVIHGLVQSGGAPELLTAINNLTGKVNVMADAIDRIEKEAADAAENVGLVRAAVEDLKTASAAMQAEIAALKEQVAKGQLDQARLDAAATVFEKADDDIDAIVLPAPSPEPTPEG